MISLSDVIGVATISHCEDANTKYICASSVKQMHMEWETLFMILYNVDELFDTF